MGAGQLTSLLIVICKDHGMRSCSWHVCSSCWFANFPAMLHGHGLASIVVWTPWGLDGPQSTLCSLPPVSFCCLTPCETILKIKYCVCVDQELQSAFLSVGAFTWAVRHLTVLQAPGSTRLSHESRSLLMQLYEKLLSQDSESSAGSGSF